MHSAVAASVHGHCLRSAPPVASSPLSGGLVQKREEAKANLTQGTVSCANAAMKQLHSRSDRCNLEKVLLGTTCCGWLGWNRVVCSGQRGSVDFTFDGGMHGIAVLCIVPLSRESSAPAGSYIALHCCSARPWAPLWSCKHTFFPHFCFGDG